MKLKVAALLGLVACATSLSLSAPAHADWVFNGSNDVSESTPIDGQPDSNSDGAVNTPTISGSELQCLTQASASTTEGYIYPSSNISRGVTEQLTFTWSGGGTPSNEVDYHLTENATSGASWVAGAAGGTGSVSSSAYDNGYGGLTASTSVDYTGYTNNNQPPTDPYTSVNSSYAGHSSPCTPSRVLYAYARGGGEDVTYGADGEIDISISVP